MTRSELRDKLARSLDANTTRPGTWTIADLDQILKEAHETVLELSEAVERRAVIPLRAGKTFYQLSAIAPDCLAPLRLIQPTTKRRMLPIAMWDLDQDRLVWETTGGNPWRWFPVGLNWIGIWPRPSADGDELWMDYAAWPMDALGDATPLEVAEELEDAILDLAVADALLWQWDVGGAAMRMGDAGKVLRSPEFLEARRLAFTRPVGGAGSVEALRSSGGAV